MKFLVGLTRTADSLVSFWLVCRRTQIFLVILGFCQLNVEFFAFFQQINQFTWQMARDFWQKFKLLNTKLKILNGNFNFLVFFQVLKIFFRIPRKNSFYLANYLPKIPFQKLISKHFLPKTHFRTFPPKNFLPKTPFRTFLRKNSFPKISSQKLLSENSPPKSVSNLYLKSKLPLKTDANLKKTHFSLQNNSDPSIAIIAKPNGYNMFVVCLL